MNPNTANTFFKETDISLYILDQILDEVFIFDRNCCLQYLNKAAERSENFQLRNVKGKSIFELYDFAHDLDETKSPALIALMDERPVSNMVCSYYVNNKEKTKTISSEPIYNKDHTLVGVCTIQRDMTRIKNIVDDNIALQNALQSYRNDAATQNPFSGIIGHSISLSKCITKAKRGADTDSSIMLIGETGSGKEVFARAIHESSKRANRPFLALNCAAIPENLLEGILFGTTKGVYTGASENDGLLMKGNSGTIFLDEINSMPLSSQAKLLRVLEDRKVTKLGSSKETPVDIRFISSINEEPHQAINAGHLREDFFYRLSVLEIAIPALSERKEDIPELVHHFIEIFNEKMDKKILSVSDNAMIQLTAYHWPGNVRQLRSCIESAMNFTVHQHQLTEEDFPEYIFNKPEHAETPYINNKKEKHFNITSFRESVTLQEKDTIIRALEKTGGNITQTANMLGISRQLLYYRIKKYNLK